VRLRHPPQFSTFGCNQTNPAAKVWWWLDERLTKLMACVRAVGWQLACVRGLDGASIIAASTNWNWEPVIDGLIVPDDPAAMFQRGEAAPVDVLLGTNTNEGAGRGHGM
jgi:hypothetical protein